MQCNSWRLAAAECLVMHASNLNGIVVKNEMEIDSAYKTKIAIANDHFKCSYEHNMQGSSVIIAKKLIINFFPSNFNKIFLLLFFI